MKDRTQISIRESLAVLALLLLNSVTPPTLAQSLPESTFAETIDVDLVNIEVWVSNASGEPVSGLASEEFTILHDGKPVAIDHFSEIRSSIPSDTLGPDSRANRPEGGDSHLVIVFDQLRLTPNSQKRLASNLRKFLDEGQIPAEQILVLRIDGGLSIDLPFGSTTEGLNDALKRLEKKEASPSGSAAGVKQVVQAMQGIWEDLNSSTGNTSLRARVNQVTGPSASQRSSILTGSGDAAASGSGGSASSMACDDFVDRVKPVIAAWADKELRKTETSLNRLADASSFLSGLEGPKTLLYLSDGLSLIPGAAAAGFVRGLCPIFQTDLEVDALPEEMRSAFLQLTRRLSANRITLHAIHASGIAASLGSSIGQASSDKRGVRGFERGYATSAREALGLLAEETGGRVVGGGSELPRELTRIGNEMGTYYSIAYSPPAGGGLRDHEIEVGTADASLQTRYRRTYSDKTTDQWLTERLESALYLGLVSNPLGVRLAAGNVSQAAPDRHRLPLHIRMPVEKLTFLGSDDRPAARLTLKVMALNASSRTLVMIDRNMLLPHPDEGAGKTLDATVEVELESGIQMFAIAVQDQGSGEASFVSTTMEIEPGPSES